MTRKEAKMVAEELFKLVKGDINECVKNTIIVHSDEWLTTKEAAAHMKVSKSHIKQNIKDIPHVKVGRLNKFTKSSLNQYMARR